MRVELDVQWAASASVERTGDNEITVTVTSGDDQIILRGEMRHVRDLFRQGFFMDIADAHYLPIISKGA